MYTKSNQPISAQCFNASFQGYFDRDLLVEQQKITGTGIVIDDQFNFFISDWKQDTLNGYSFIRLISGPIIYGFFKNNAPIGALAFSFGKYKLFICRSDAKEIDAWNKEAVLIDTESRIFYLLELTHRDQQKSMDLDKTQKIGSETFRAQASKYAWKIKIIDRCTLKNDGKLVGYSKKISSLSVKQIQVKYDTGIFTLQQQNQINLILSVLGNSFTDPSMISPSIFLKNIADNNPKICLLEEGQSHREIALFLSLLQNNHGASRSREHKLGIIMNANSQSVRSVGTYDNDGNLNGIGIKVGRLGDGILGFFRQNLMVKQYCHSKQQSKGIVSIQARQILQNQHLKSLNYINTCFYISDLEKIVNIGNRIIRYTQAFQKEFQKRHFSYNDTQISENSEMMNVIKYGEQSRPKIENYAQEVDTSLTEFKRPGFIMHKNRSKERERSKSPVGVLVKQGSRSPGGIHRQAGKISKGYSPSGRSITGQKSVSQRRPAF